MSPAAGHRNPEHWRRASWNLKPCDEKLDELCQFHGNCRAGDLPDAGQNLVGIVPLLEGVLCALLASCSSANKPIRSKSPSNFSR